MSLFSSMNTAISGLGAQSRALGHISDNIANSTTVGYKKLDTSFSSMVTATGNLAHNPGGVRAAPVRHTALQGNMTQTQVETNLSINGPGFFNVSAPSVRPDGSTVFDAGLFTRAGDFEMNKDGYLVNGGGYYLNGQTVVDPQTGRVDPTVSPIRISQMLDRPVPTSYVQYSANLPASVSAAEDIDATTGDVELPATQTTVYDGFGRKRELDLQWTKLDPADPAGANRWRLSVSLDGADLNGAAAGASRDYYVQFNGDGDNRGTPQWISDVNAAPATLPAVGESAAQALAVTEPDGSSWNFELRLGEFGRPGGVSQFASNGIEGVRVDQDGVAIGSLAKISFDNQGFLYLNYDNGRTVPAFKVPVALFEAPDALEAESKTAFRPTYGSGAPAIVSAGERGAGEILPLTLEASNVDIADEFTKMIVSQRAYSANARVVTVSDRMLEETLSIAR